MVERFRQESTDTNRLAVKAMLEAALQSACEQVHEAAVALTGQGGQMGTTFDCLLVAGTTAFIGHVGDARVYLHRGADIHQLTEDHSLVQQQIREGLLTVEQARKARFKNVITRALGVFPSVIVDTAHFELDPGDRVFLCSDGLYRYIGKRELGLSLAGEVDEQTVSDLVERANERGGRDNITAVLCVFEPDHAREEQATADGWRPSPGRPVPVLHLPGTDGGQRGRDSALRRRGIPSSKKGPGRSASSSSREGVDREVRAGAQTGPAHLGIASLPDGERSADAIASAPTTSWSCTANASCN